jgi:hypothetical protein
VGLGSNVQLQFGDMTMVNRRNPLKPEGIGGSAWSGPSGIRCVWNAEVPFVGIDSVGGTDVLTVEIQCQ